MKFAPAAILQALRSIEERQATGIFYGDNEIATDFVPCRLNEEELHFSDHQELLKKRSILRAGLLTELSSALKELKNEHFVEGAVVVRFDLANYNAGGLGLTIDGSPIEMADLALEINALELCCADVNGSGLVRV